MVDSMDRTSIGREYVWLCSTWLLSPSPRVRVCGFGVRPARPCDVAVFHKERWDGRTRTGVGGAGRVGRAGGTWKGINTLWREVEEASGCRSTGREQRQAFRWRVWVPYMAGDSNPATRPNGACHQMRGSAGILRTTEVGNCKIKRGPSAEGRV